MKKSIQRKKIQGIRSAVLFVLLAVLLTSCASTPDYSYLGTWNYDSGERTYVNRDQLIKMSFPDDTWSVYIDPWHEDLEGFPWGVPTIEDPSYHTMLGVVPGVGLIFQIIIEPVAVEISLDDYVLVTKGNLDMTFGKEGSFSPVQSEVVERGGRETGVLIYELDGMKFLMVAFKEEGRFTMLGFNCFTYLFETKLDTFWNMVDSYEYLG